MGDSKTKQKAYFPAPKPDRYSHPGVAGRKPNPSTLTHRALALVDKKLPEIFNALIQKAIEGDREAQIYLIDRRLGKPKQSTDIDIKGDVLTAAVAVLLYQLDVKKQHELEEYKQLIEGKIVSDVT